MGFTLIYYLLKSGVILDSFNFISLKISIIIIIYKYNIESDNLMSVQLMSVKFRRIELDIKL